MAPLVAVTFDDPIATPVDHSRSGVHGRVGRRRRRSGVNVPPAMNCTRWGPSRGR